MHLVFCLCLPAHLREVAPRGAEVGARLRRLRGRAEARLRPETLGSRCPERASPLRRILAESKAALGRGLLLAEAAKRATLLLRLLLLLLLRQGREGR